MTEPQQEHTERRALRIEIVVVLAVVFQALETTHPSG